MSDPKFVGPSHKQHECIDCKAGGGGIRTRKLATGPGEPKRCATHLRAFKAAQRRTRRASHVERTYDISAKDAGELLVFQGGRCWICGKADGTTKALAVDHDHSDDWPRGRTCGVCNQFIGQRLGDDPEKAKRLMWYLLGDTPYRRMLAQRWLETTHRLRLSADKIRVRPDDPNDSGSIAVWWLDGDVWNVNYTLTLDKLQAYATLKGER